LASAYATIASGGTYCVPTPVLSITTSDHKTVALPKNQCKRVVERDVANGVSKILKTVLTNGTARGIGGLDGGRPVAGKTGTSDGSNETWFVGYTPQLSTAVWVGTPNDPGNKRELRDLRLGGQVYRGQVFGATIAAPIWKRIMDRSSVGMPFRDFGDPGEKVQVGDVVSIPSVYGMSVGEARATLTRAGFRPVVGAAVGSSTREGLAVGTQPRSRALRGSTVVIFTSTGVEKPSPGPAPKKPDKPKNRGGSGRG
jgi:membrane peptidoglycan carboxypeptidase